MAQSGRLVLVRHAQASLGSADYDRLSGLGHRQAERLAERVVADFSGAHGVRGSLRRHRQTAEALDQTGGYAIDPNLDEYRVDGLMRAAFESSDRLRLPLPPPEAADDPVGFLDLFLESFPAVLEAWQTDRIECQVNGRWHAFHQRVSAAGNRLRQILNEGETVIAVTSAGVISTLVAELLERDLVWQRHLNVSLYNASVSELMLVPGRGWVARYINCVAHLDAKAPATLA